MAAVAVPVVVFDPMFADLFGYDVPSWARWIAPVPPPSARMREAWPGSNRWASP